MTPKDLLEQLREYLTDCGYDIYNDYKSCMPSTLKRFDDVDCLWVSFPREDEDVEGKKLKVTYVKFNFEYRNFGGKKEICYDICYSTGGSSGNYRDDDMKSFVDSFLKCHNIKIEHKKRQMTLFDFI